MGKITKENPTVYSSGGGNNQPFESLESLKKLVVEDGGKKEIKKSAGEDISKNPADSERAEKHNPGQAVFEKRIREILPEILNAEAIGEAINANITSEKKAEKARKVISLAQDDLNSVAKNPEWYKLKWRDNELRNALKKHFIKQSTLYFGAEKLTGVKKFYNYLEKLCKTEKKKPGERKSKPLNKEKEEFLEDFKNKVEKEVSEKLNESDKEILEKEPVKEFIKLRRVTPLAKKAILTIRESFQKNKDLKKEDIVNLLQKGTARWEHLSPKEQDLVMTDFEQLARNKKNESRKISQKIKEKEIKKTEINQREQLMEDEAGGEIKSSGKYYTGVGAPEDAKEELIKLKNGKKTKKEEKQEKITQKPERTKEDIIAGIKAAAEVGDEEQIVKLEKELKDFDKTGEQLFEEAQALEAEKKFRETNPPKIKMEEIERKGIPLSRQEELEKLKGELEQTRRDYLEVDYKKKKAWKRMADFFGKFIKSDQGPENDDVLHYKDIYLNKLFNYKNALLEDAKARGASNKELGDLVKLFDTEVNCNLADVRDQIKMENQEEKLLGFFTKHSKNIIGWYNKLPRYKKLAVGTAFGLTAAAGASFGGAAAAGVIGTAVSAKRIFMGAVTGTGVALGAEAFLRRRTEKRIENSARATTEQFEKYESLTLEEKLKLVDEKIKWAVGDIDKKIARHKKTKLAAASLGILAGTVIGSGTASELFGEGFKKTTGLTQKVAEHFGYHLEAPVPIGGTHTPEIPAAEAPEISSKADLLTIKEKGGLEGSITKYFENHPELVEKYGKLHGHRNFDPGQIAHRLYLDYIHENTNPLDKSLNMVYPGAEIEIDPATLKISDFSDTKGAIGRAIEQAAGSHEKWAGMKNLSLKELAGTAKNKIVGLSNEYGKFWGPEAEVKSGEKIKDWLARIVRLAAEKK